MSLIYTLPKRTDGIPLYIQIREALRQNIIQKILQPGQKLPSEDELAAQYGVSRMTIRQGISDLIDAGLLYRRHGLGTFVAQTQVERDHTRLTNFFESCRSHGTIPGARVLRQEIIPATARVAQALALTEGEPVIRLETLRTVDNQPITLHDACLPQKLFPQLLEQELGLESRHVWELIEGCGFRLVHVMERLEAQLADSYLADLLQVEEGAPILYGERVLYTDDGTPVKFADCYNRGDKFSLTVKLVR